MMLLKQRASQKKLFVIGSKRPQVKQGSERKTILTEEEEEHILIMLVKCYSLAWPVESDEVSLVIKSYFHSCGRKEARFKDNKPGEYWQISLRKWWRDHIRLRKPEVLTKARTQGLNEQTLKQFLDMYYNVLNGNGFFRDADAGQHIFNVNETGCLAHSNKRWLFFKNYPRAVFFFYPNMWKVRRKIPSPLVWNYCRDVSHQITLLIDSPILGIWSFNRSPVECVTEVEV